MQLFEALIELILELGEALMDIVEVVEIRREGVFEAVKFEKDVKSQVNLGIREGVGIGIKLERKVVKEVMNKGIVEASLVYTPIEKEA